MEQIVEEMMEYVCDCLCKHRTGADQEELDEICCECEMGRFREEILKHNAKEVVADISIPAIPHLATGGAVNTDKHIVPTIEAMFRSNVHKSEENIRKEAEIKAEPNWSKSKKATSARIDYGKIKALSDAGWSIADIADEMKMTNKAVSNARYKIKKGLVEICSD